MVVGDCAGSARDWRSVKKGSVSVSRIVRGRSAAMMVVAGPAGAVMARMHVSTTSAAVSHIASAVNAVRTGAMGPADSVRGCRPVCSRGCVAKAAC